MKLYYMVDSTFYDMRNNFIDSMKDPQNFSLVELPIATPQFEEDSSNYQMQGGGQQLWEWRLLNIINIINNSKPNEYFVFCDVDIVLYKPLLPALEAAVKDNDVLFLREFFDESHKREIQEERERATGVPHKLQAGNINFGFNLIKACDETKRFFRDILTLVRQTGLWEQELINRTLYNPHNYNFKWDLFPPTFFSTSVGKHHLNTKIKDVVLYHANCAITAETKYAFMHEINQTIMHGV